MNILVTGSNGQLGQCIKRCAEYENHSFVFTDINEENHITTDKLKYAKLDITNYDDILKLIKKENIDIIINCAAYTNVDKAEDEANIAYVVNAAAVDDLARAASEVGAKMIHISTDYVFDGKGYKPYNENNITNPIGIYGKTKRAGEEFLFNRLGDDGIVIRTAWLYSNYGKNFVKTIINLGKEKEELKVVFDQVGTPTYAMDLADTIFKIINSNNWKGGIYHFTNEGVCSWYDFANAIREITNLPCDVIPVHSNEFPTKAERPHYSVLDKTKIKGTYGIIISHWRWALERCIETSNV